jgi:hypothetical protein
VKTAFAFGIALLLAASARPAAGQQPHAANGDLPFDFRAAGGDVCVVFPASLRTHGACDRLDYAELERRNDSPKLSMAIVLREGWSMGLFVTVTRHDLPDEPTHAEALALFSGELERTRVGDVVAWRRPYAIAAGDDGRLVHFVVGRDTFVILAASFPASHVEEARSIVDSVVATIRVTPPTSLWNRLLEGSGRLLIGAPLVALAGLFQALRNRKKAAP